jgi:hypothetical protein
MSDEIPDGISSDGVPLYGSRCEGVLLTTLVWPAFN